MHAYGSFWHTPAVNQGALCPQLARADIMAERVDSGFDRSGHKPGRNLAAQQSPARSGYAILSEAPDTPTLRLIMTSQFNGRIIP